MDINGRIRKFTWRIENFSSIKDKKLYSEIFIVGGYKWRVLICPKGDKNFDQLSIYLDVADSATLHSGWNRSAQFGLAIIDQLDRKTSVVRATHVHEFNATKPCWGFSLFLPLSELHDRKRGYLVGDNCFVEAYILTDVTKSLISSKLMLETILDKRKIKGADCVKAKLVENTTSSTQSSPFQAIESKEPTEEDMQTFFASLDSEIWSSKPNILYYQEEAKKALCKLDEALNVSPANLYDSGKFALVKQAFEILASYGSSSTTLTVKKKNELLGMKKSLIELADRAVKAAQDKNRLTANKVSSKLMMTRSLEGNTIRFKEVDSKVKQVEQELVAFQELVEEAQKRRKILLAERKEIFGSSKKMKMDLEALEKEYETNAKMVEDEKKSVEAEWERMKDFISSIKKEF